jgi:hypothetical protein
MIKEYIFNEVLGDFNEDVILANKPSALYDAFNADMDSQPGTLRRRKGSAIFGAQIVNDKSLLSLHDFIKSDGTRVPLAVINNAGGTQSVVYYYSAGWTISALITLTASLRARFANYISSCFLTNGTEIRSSVDGNTWGTSNLLNTITITSAAYADPIVTLTVPSGHQVVAGDSITVSGLAPAGYNGTFTVTAVTDTTIAYSVASLGALTDLVGSFTVQFALPANDVVEYNSLLYLIGLSGFRSDIMWCNAPVKGSSSYSITWNRQNNVAIKLGDGEDLIAGQEYRGALYLFKNSSITRTVSPIATNGVKVLSSNIGANSKDCIQVVSDQLIFFCDGNRNAKKGFYSYNSLSDAEPKIISEPIQKYIDGMAAGTRVIASTIGNLYIAYIGNVSNANYALSRNYSIVVFNAVTNRWHGIWSYGTPVTAMAHLTISNVTNTYFGNDDGVVYKTETGGEDLVSGGTGNPVNFEATSHPLYLAKGQKGVRRNFVKRKVNNIWVVGETLNGVKFRYRFDKLLANTDGWRVKEGLSGPVAPIPILNQHAYFLQWSLSALNRKLDVVIIRKLVIDFD